MIIYTKASEVTLPNARILEITIKQQTVAYRTLTHLSCNKDGGHKDWCSRRHAVRSCYEKEFQKHREERSRAIG